MPRPKVQRNEIKYKFSKHDIVWAKTAGYRWWPASITSLPSKSRCFYKVDFIGDRSYALLSEEELAPYQDHHLEYQINKKNDKHFANAVTIAAKKYQQLIAKQTNTTKNNLPNECKTSQLKQQLNQQNHLPQIPENIQQHSSNNQQQIQNPTTSTPQQLIHTHQHIEQIQDSHFYDKTHERTPTQVLKASQLLQEEPLSLEPQNKQKMIEQLLAKYKLTSIPDVKDLKKAQKQQSCNSKRGPHCKRKLISKSKQISSQEREQQFSQDAMLTRKIYRYLLQKLHSCEQSMSISMSLKQQMVLQKKQQLSCLRKVMQWIQMTDCQNIVKYHNQWVNLYKQNERQREKHSNLTMEEQSDAASVK